MKLNRLLPLVLALAAILLTTSPALAADDVSVYVAPIGFKGKISSKTEKKIEKYINQYIGKTDGFKAYDKKSLKKVVRKSKTRKKIIRCKGKYKCLLKAAKGSGLDVVVTAYYKNRSGKIKTTIRVIDARNGSVLKKEKATYKTEKKARSKKNIRKLVAAFMPEASMFADEDEDEDEEGAEGIVVLYIPPMFKGDFDDEEEELQEAFFKALSKAEGYRIYTYKNLKNVVKNKKKLRRIKKCKTKKKCLTKAARRTDLRLVVSGLFKLTDDDEVFVKLVAMDLKEKKLWGKAEKIFGSINKAGKRKSQQRLVTKLLPAQGKAVADDEEEDEEEEAEEEEKPKPKPKRVKRYSSKQIRNEVREALKLAIIGRSAEAIKGLNRLKDTKRCECNEDGKATDVLVLLRDLGKAEKDVEIAKAKNSSKDMLENCERVEAIVADLNTRLSDYRIKGKLGTRLDLTMMRAEAYYLKGRGEETQQKYLDAVESWNRAIELYPAHQQAAKKLQQIPMMAKRMLAQARTLMVYDAKKARIQVAAVMALIPDENNDIHQDALDLLEDLESYENSY